MAVGPLAQVHISVTDLDRSVAFYREVLGIPLLFQTPAPPMAFLASGDVRLYLGVPERPELATRVMLYFRVDDLAAEHTRLTEAGVTFLAPPHLVHRDDTGELWMAFFNDPDGHHLALMRQVPGGAPPPA